jgi:hypothetical protein
VGQVHNKECKLLLLQYAFEELRFQRVEFEVAHQNIRSQKAVEKIGGVRKGGCASTGCMPTAPCAIRSCSALLMMNGRRKKRLQQMVQTFSKVQA